MRQPIFMYWHQGWDEAPEVAKACLKSWVDLNNGAAFEVIALDFTALPMWIHPQSPEFETINFFLLRLKQKKGAGSLAFLSDYLRVVLLAKHGGIWADATLYCLKPLKDWLPTRKNIGFPISPSVDRLFEVWFIDNRAQDPLVHQWKQWLENPHFSNYRYTSFIDDWNLNKYQVAYWLLNLSKRSWVLSASIWNSFFCQRIFRRRPYFMVNYALQKAILANGQSTSWTSHLLPIDYSELYKLMLFSEVDTKHEAHRLIQNCPFIKLSHHMTYWKNPNDYGLSIQLSLDSKHN